MTGATGPLPEEVAELRPLLHELGLLEVGVHAEEPARGEHADDHEQQEAEQVAVHVAVGPVGVPEVEESVPHDQPDHHRHVPDDRSRVFEPPFPPGPVDGSFVGCHSGHLTGEDSREESLPGRRFPPRANVFAGS